MVIDRGSFFVALATLAVGGVGGYYAGQHGPLDRAARTGPEGATEPQGLAAPPPPMGTAAKENAAPAEPICDDSVGAPGACPSPGYSADEGEQGCGLATKRCQDFKQAMKPRVATQAVQCLNDLTPAQRCDPARVALCAHAALMNACTASDTPALAGAADSSDAAVCRDVVKDCAGAPFLTPTARDCRATLAGLTTVGRAQVASCMRTHCGDKGLLGCEASLSAATP